MSILRFIDLFSGTGGIRLALEQTMLAMNVEAACVFSSEIDKKACETYELNFGEKPSGDIREHINTIPDFDFLLAGFPCQSFSYAGKQQGFGDTRGTLFFEVEKVLKKYKPRGFLLENVRGLTTHDKGRTLRTIMHSLEELGYKTTYLLCNSSNFGVPQNRVRIYILGTLHEQVKTTIVSDVGAADSHSFKKRKLQQDFFDRVSGKSHKVVADILENDAPKKYNCSTEFIEMLSQAVAGDFQKLHGVRLIDTRGGNSLNSWNLGIKGKCTKEEQNFMSLLISNRRKKIFGTHQDGKMLTKGQILTFYPSKKFDQVTTSLIKKGYLKCIGGKYNPVCGNMSFEVFKFLDPHSISITLTSSDTNRLGVVQNGIPRRITPREAARLQGFPDSFILHPNDNATYKQMGNAVSVPVVQEIIQDLFLNNPSLLPKKKILSNNTRVVDYPTAEYLEMQYAAIKADTPD